MRLSPADIRQQHFSVKMFRGFDPQEVDTFLEDVADDYETLLRETAALREQLGGHEERSRGVADTEKTLKDTLVTTQRLSDDLKENAKREAQLILREAGLNAETLAKDARLGAEKLVKEARLGAEKLMEEARAEEAKLLSEIQALKRTRRQLIEDLRATVERYDRALSQDLADGAADAQRQA